MVAFCNFVTLHVVTCLPIDGLHWNFDIKLEMDGTLIPGAICLSNQRLIEPQNINLEFGNMYYQYIILLVNILPP